MSSGASHSPGMRKYHGRKKPSASMWGEGFHGSEAASENDDGASRLEEEDDESLLLLLLLDKEVLLRCCCCCRRRASVLCGSVRGMDGEERGSVLVGGGLLLLLAP